jgi:integrase/recombinase XerC
MKKEIVVQKKSATHELGTPLVRSSIPGVSLLAVDEINLLFRDFYGGKSESTIKAYKKGWEDFRRFIGAETQEAAAPILLSRGNGRANILITKYKSHLKAKGILPSTINLRLSALKSLVKIGRKFGHISWTLDVEGEKVKTYRDTRGPGMENIDKVLEILREQTGRKAVRDYAMLRLLRDLGIRRGSVVGLDIEDVDLKKGELYAKLKRKTQKVRFTIPKVTQNAVKEWMKIRKATEGPLFTNLDRAGKGERLTGTSLTRIVNGRGKEIGVRMWPHGFRHTAITEALKKGFTIPEVMGFSKHADPRTLMKYNDNLAEVQGKVSKALTSA